MATVEKRLETIMQDLSPEKKAHLVIEDTFREPPVLTPVQRRAILQGMAPEEGRRYDAYIDRCLRAREVVFVLQALAEAAERLLMERDRLLFYLYGLGSFLDRLSFGAKPLLENNPNLMPGQPLEFRLIFATVRLGVWGRERHPWPPGDAPLVQLCAETEEVLDLYSRRVRGLVGDLKAILAYVEEESRSMGLEVLKGIALHAVEPVRRHDQDAIIPDLVVSVAAMVGKEKRTRKADGSGLYDLESPWALVWEEVEENAETARRVRANPADFTPVSWQHQIETIKPCLLDDMKALARKDGQG